MSITPKVTYRVNAISIKMPIIYFIKVKVMFLICMDSQKIPNSQSNSEKEAQSWKHEMFSNIDFYAVLSYVRVGIKYLKL